MVVSKHREMSLERAELLYNFLERNYSLPKEILSPVISLKNRAPDSNASSLTRLPSRDWMVARKSKRFACVSFVCFLRSSHCSSLLYNSVLKCYCLDCRFHLLLRLPTFHCRVGKVRVTLRRDSPGSCNNVYVCFLLIKCTIMRSTQCFSFHTLII